VIGLEVLVLCAYGLAFLAADAHIFGLGSVKYQAEAQFWPFQEQMKVGIIPLRPYLFRLRFFRELFHCYFCMGVWTGAFTHLLLLNLYGPRYVLHHDMTWQAWAQGLVVAVTFCAPAVYVVDRVVTLLEKTSSSSQS
jgi:hypothetical protein